MLVSSAMQMRRHDAKMMFGLQCKLKSNRGSRISCGSGVLYRLVELITASISGNFVPGICFPGV
jgi:hypothetical protein